MPCPYTFDHRSQTHKKDFEDVAPSYIFISCDNFEVVLPPKPIVIIPIVFSEQLLTQHTDNALQACHKGIDFSPRIVESERSADGALHTKPVH